MISMSFLFPDDSTGSESRHRVRRALYRVLFAALLIGGVIVGMSVGRSLNLNATLGLHTNRLSFPENHTLLQTGSVFPVPETREEEGGVDAWRRITACRNTIVCFVANGCDPCQSFVNSISQASILRDTSYCLVLLTTSPKHFREHYRFPVFGVTERYLDDWQIHQYPTMVGVDSTGTVAFVIPGYMPELTAPMFRELF
jgi:hypothetical protein